MKHKLTVRGRKRVFILILFCIFVLITSILIYIFFNEELLQGWIKERIIKKVIVYEAELLEIVEEGVNETEYKIYFERSGELEENYKQKLNNNRIRKICDKFDLFQISTEEKGVIAFTVYPSVISILWNDYIYGFYYSQNDKAYNVIENEEVYEMEFEGNYIGFKTYWYRTENYG